MWSSYRLRKAQEFTAVIQQGKKLVNSDLAIFACPNHLANCRFGISIPRKLVKKATQRNYYKRQVKNIIILWLKANNDSCQIIQPDHQDLVIIVRSGFLLHNFAAKQDSWERLILALTRPEQSAPNWIYGQ